MKIKYTLWLIMMVLSVLFLVGCTQPPDNLSHANVSETQNGTDTVLKDTDADISKNGAVTVKIDGEKSTFEFVGYAIGKSHAGTFDILNGTLSYEGDVLIGASGVIDATSVNTGIKKLDNHLRADDFFDVLKYTQIIIESSSITYDQTGIGTITGELTFHGVTKEITFPVTVTASGVETDFLLDTTPFGMTNLGVNSDVRIVFSLVAE